MTSTELKLEEAKFFLSHLKKKSVQGKTFNHYLNAFVGSARSVLWVMRNEFCHIKGWEKWYDSVAPNGDEEALLSFFNFLRTETVKKKPLKSTTLISFTIPIDDLTDEQIRHYEQMTGKKGTLTVYSSKDEIDQSKKQIILKFSNAKTWRTVNTNQAEEDIVDQCQFYFNFLDSVVQKCISKFS